jgi:hypothetical protein
VHSSRFSPTPLEVRDEIARVGLGISVLRLEPELQVIGVGNGEERPPPPPPWTREPSGLAQRRRPQVRTREDEHE